MSDDDSSIENRVYLFKDLARSFLKRNGARLASGDPQEREAMLSALGDIAYVACVLADTEDLGPDEVRKLVKKT